MRRSLTKLKIDIFNARSEISLFFSLKLHLLICKKGSSGEETSISLLRNLRNANSVLWITPGTFKPGEKEKYPAALEYMQTYDEFRKQTCVSSHYNTQIVQYGVSRETLDFNSQVSFCTPSPGLVFIMFGASWDSLPKKEKLRSDIKEFKRQNPNTSLVAIYSDTAIPRDLNHLIRMHRLFDLIIVNDQPVNRHFPCKLIISPSITPTSEKTEVVNLQKSEFTPHRYEWDVGIFGTPYPERVEYFHELISKGFTVYMPSQFGIRLNYDDYIRAQSMTKIQICTTLTYNGKRRQMKGHFGESLNAGSCTLVDDSSVINQEFREGEHFLKFNNKDELIHLCRILLENDLARQKLSYEGQKKYRSIGYSTNYWLWIENILLGV